MPDRESEPIVVEGAAVPKLLGAEPGRIVAFRYDGRWRQVPVQVDERAIVDYEAVRQDGQGSPFGHLAYSDPGTFAGPDPDPALDGDDEIATMAMDAGDGAAIDAGDPKGVQPGSRATLRIADPLRPRQPARFLYLFRSRGSLDPAAGRSYVDYAFRLLSGDYRTTYDFNGVGDNQGPPANPEDSLVSTDQYVQHLGDRWIGDGLGLRAGGATGVDILDGDKTQVSYGCGRAEVTFARGGGGFIANISGPVRAIRSYIGANSGTYTQRDQIYYRGAEVTTTYLRVHPGITNITQFLDYSAAADGMTYRNSAQPLGVTVDGVPDPALETGNALGPEIQWEQVSGEQGTVTVVNRSVTDVPGVVVGSYYQDDLTPSTTQCTGYADAEAHAASGPTVTIPSGVNTDPTLGAAFDFTGTRTTFFSAPGGDASLGSQRSAQVDSPLQISLGKDPSRTGLRVRAPGGKRGGRRGRHPHQGRARQRRQGGDRPDRAVWQGGSQARPGRALRSHRGPRARRGRPRQHRRSRQRGRAREAVRPRAPARNGRRLRPGQGRRQAEALRALSGRAAGRAARRSGAARGSTGGSPRPCRSRWRARSGSRSAASGAPARRPSRPRPPRPARGCG